MATATAPRAILVKLGENVFELRNGSASQPERFAEAAAIVAAAAARVPTRRPEALADPIAPARPVRYEISNGHGGEGLARRLAGMLRDQGFARPRLTNHLPYDQPASYVEYRDGYRQQAEAFAARLPFTPQVLATASNGLAVDVRLLLGRDLSTSDACEILGLCTPTVAGRSAPKVAVATK